MAAFTLDRGEFVITFFQSSGPGGQNVNKVATAVRIAWRVADTGIFSGERKAYLLERLESKLDGAGVLAVTSRRFRTQQANLAAALSRLEDLVAKALERPEKRLKTRPTAGSKVRRLAAKKRRSEIKNARSRANECGDD